MAKAGFLDRTQESKREKVKKSASARASHCVTMTQTSATPAQARRPAPRATSAWKRAVLWQHQLLRDRHLPGRRRWRAGQRGLRAQRHGQATAHVKLHKVVLAQNVGRLIYALVPVFSTVESNLAADIPRVDRVNIVAQRLKTTRDAPDPMPRWSVPSPPCIGGSVGQPPKTNAEAPGQRSEGECDQRGRPCTPPCCTPLARIRRQRLLSS